MYAVTISEPGGPDVLQWREVPEPEPAPDEVVIDVYAAGVNRADLLQRQGYYPPPPGASDYPGLECSGTVRACGADVTQWRVDDQVCALLPGGGYAERVAVHESLVLPVPDNVSVTAAAALVEVAATVYSNVTQFGRLAAGESVLIHGGSGGVGSFAIQWARTIGATVFTTSRSANHEMLSRLGADVTIDYGTEDFGEVVAEHTNGLGVDVILDVMGAAYLDKNVDALAPDGRCAIIGMQGGRKGELSVGKLLAKRGTIMAAGLRSRPLADRAAIVAGLGEEVWPHVSAGRLQPVIASRVPMAQASAAHEAMEQGGHVGKILLTT